VEFIYNFDPKVLELVEEKTEKVAGGKMNIKKVTTKVLATALSVLSITGGIGVNAMAPTNQTKGQSKKDELMRYIDLYWSLAYGKEHDLNSINDLLF